MGATTVPITDDRAATVAALDAAILALASGGDTFLAPPTDLGDRVGLAASALPTPNAYTGAHFLAVDYQDWRLDTPTVGVQFDTLAPGEGSRWSMRTGFGYNLHLIGQPFDAPNTFDYVAPPGPVYPTNA